MWLALTSTKVAWSCSHTKRDVVPLPIKVTENKVVQKYRSRAKELKTCTFNEWLCTVNETPTQPIAYKCGNTCGIEILLCLSQFFFQQVLMNVAHRKVEELYHGDEQAMPVNIRYFEFASYLMPDIWNYDAIERLFNSQGHKIYYIQTVVTFFASLQDMLYLWRLHVIWNDQLSSFSTNATANFDLQGLQMVIFNQFKSALVRRDNFMCTLLNPIQTT